MKSGDIILNLDSNTRRGRWKMRQKLTTDAVGHDGKVRDVTIRYESQKYSTTYTKGKITFRLNIL